MNIENIEAFVYVVHYNSFHKAADALFLSQPSISARIQTLERELGIRLLERDGKRVALTVQGEQFLPYAQQTLHFYQLGKQMLLGNKPVLEELKLGYSRMVSDHLLHQLITSFKSGFPDMRLRITMDTSDQLVQKVLDEEIHIALVENVSHPALHAFHYLEEPIRLCVYEGHPFASMDQATIVHVSEEPMVYYECGPLNWVSLHRWFEEWDRLPKVEYHVDNMEAAKKLILQKMAIGFLPTCRNHREIEEGRLVPVHVRSGVEWSLVTNLIIKKGSNTELSMSSFIHKTLNK